MGRTSARAADIEEELVDQLGQLTAADLSHVDDLVADRIQGGPHRPKKTFIAAEHHRDLGLFGSRLHTGHRRIREEDPLLFQPPVDLQRGDIADRAQVDQNEAGFGPQGDALFPEYHLFHQFRIGEAQEKPVDPCGDVGRRLRRLRALAGEKLDRHGIDVVHPHRKPGFQHIQRHPFSHGPEADKTNFFFHLQYLQNISIPYMPRIFAGLSETIIRISFDAIPLLRASLM